MENEKESVMVKKDLNPDQISAEKDVAGAKQVKPKKVIKIFGQIGWAFLLLFLIILSTALFWGYRQIKTFAQTAEVSTSQLKQTLQTGWQTTPQTTNGHKNFLILGLDQLATRGESPALTDTIILLSLDFSTGQIRTLSLPRDLWSQAYQTKINALYTYGQEREPDQPTVFPERVIEEMTGITIHHTLTVSMAELAAMVDLLGGVPVEIEQGFIDEQFPRPDVDVTKITDPKLLYETVVFKAGTELMNGQRALKYMRSRHGDNEQNTDLSRGYRQQAVIHGLVNKFSESSMWLEMKMLGRLYRFYLDNFSEEIPPDEIIATGKTLWPVRHNLSLKFNHLEVYPDDPQGIIEHPHQSDYDGQWVYVIRDSQEFKEIVQSKLLEN